MATRNSIYRRLHNAWLLVFGAAMATMFLVPNDYYRTFMGLTVMAYAAAVAGYAIATKAAKCASCSGLLYAPRGHADWVVSTSPWVSARCKYCGHRLDERHGSP